MELKIIDTHVHTWDLRHVNYDWLKADTSILNRSYLLNELTPQVNDTNVSAGLLVQAANNVEDTEYMFKRAADTNWIKGVVGWLPLLHPAETARLLREEYLPNPYFKGIRHLIHIEQDAQWLLQDAVLESLQLLAAHHIPYDLVGVQTTHIKTALQVAEKIPGLKFVFDHLNQPPIQTKEKFGEWGSLMKHASVHPNFYAKISGLGTASGGSIMDNKENIKPYIAFILEHFGTARCFCGGDWPVSLLSAGYAETWQVYQTILKELLDDSLTAAVLYTNAAKFYKL